MSLYGPFITRGFCLPMNRTVLVLYLGRRYHRHRSSFSRNGGLNQRWKSWFQRKPQRTNLIRPYHTSQYPSRESRLMALELKRRGDFRNVDDLSDPEFNELYLDAISGSLEFMVDTATKTSIPQSLIDQQTSPNFLQPQIYNSQSASWAPFSNEARTLGRGDILKIASWNLFFSAPAAAARASTAIAYLRTMFGQEPHNLVVMFQELRQESLEVILEDKWTQQNFVLSNTEPPYFDCADNKSFDEKPNCIPSRYFTLMMISRNLPISNCFRLPFISEIERDALVVEIPVSEDDGSEALKRLLRLCITHLKLLYIGKELRFHQLA
ncbi:hypothetical protein V8C40DRAFT_285341 [Trichoderma camerunense]